MEKGIFITIEGADGSGKTTQLNFIKEFFSDRNILAVFTREPGGTKIGEDIRSIILDKNNSEMSHITEAFLYAASRAQHVEEIIRPQLEEGKIVVCDRFIDSSIAYQGYGRELGDMVRIINEYAIGGVMPHRTIFLDVDPEIGKNRMGERQLDRLELEKLEFHQKVYEGYKALEKIYPNRFVAINGRRPIEDVKEDIEKLLIALLGKMKNE